MKAGITEMERSWTLRRARPKAGSCPPVLSNIHLHYVLDLWFEKKFRKICEGEAHIVRTTISPALPTTSPRCLTDE